jgi:hypothetical protein
MAVNIKDDEMAGLAVQKTRPLLDPFAPNFGTFCTGNLQRFQCSDFWFISLDFRTNGVAMVGPLRSLPPHLNYRLASATPTAVSAMPISATRPSVSLKSGQAINAVQGGTRKNRLATCAAAPRRIST